MKLLESFSNAFDDTPKSSVKLFLAKQREKLGDADFVQTMFSFYGGRGYNQFLDYKLLAIKFAVMLDKFHLDGYEKVYEIVSHLFFDDRHDMYQNIPYYLQDLIELNVERKKDILSSVAYALIDCFNVNGTEDINSENFVIKEN